MDESGLFLTGSLKWLKKRIDIENNVCKIWIRSGIPPQSAGVVVVTVARVVFMNMNRLKMWRMSRILYYLVS